MASNPQKFIFKFYQSVINDTIDSCYQSYADDGLDRNVLDELKLLWMTKLKESPAIRHDLDSLIPDSNQTNGSNSDVSASGTTSNNNTIKKPGTASIEQTSLLLLNSTATKTLNTPQQTSLNVSQSNSTTIATVQPQSCVQQQPLLQRSRTTNANNSILMARSHHPNQQLQPVGGQTVIPGTVMQLDQARLIGVQITLPQNRIVHIQVPQIFLTGRKLKEIITGSVIQATMGMSTTEAKMYLQQHINQTYQNQIRSMVLTRIVAQLDGLFDDSDDEQNEKGGKMKKLKKSKLKYISEMSESDGDADSVANNSSMDGGDTSVSSSDDDKSSESGSKKSIVGPEEQLNSDDDLTDEDTEDLFETENIIVCQYDKIIRNRNKWRFSFKEGIMNLSGKDYVFSKLFGLGDW